jgi:hypothetical protein
MQTNRTTIIEKFGIRRVHYRIFSTDFAESVVMGLYLAQKAQKAQTKWMAICHSTVREQRESGL